MFLKVKVYVEFDKTCCWFHENVFELKMPCLFVHHVVIPRLGRKVTPIAAKLILCDFYASLISASVSGPAT